MKIRIIKYDKKVELEELLEKKLTNIEKVRDTVLKILRDVRKNRDKALFKYTRKFDKFDIDSTNIRISGEDIKRAYNDIDPDFLNALKIAKKNIERYHRAQFRQIRREWKVKTEIGTLGEKATPIESIGMYIPKGINGYPSTVLMTSIPAKIAGVNRIVLISAPPISSATIVAADLCSVDEIYRVAGAQGIAALAHGTESIGRVDKIVGPGNVYVTAAKMLVYGIVDIDIPAGPSEVLIIADRTANPEFIAADILSQLEHDQDAQAVLVTDSSEIAEKTMEKIDLQFKSLKNKSTIEKSMKNSAIIIAQNIKECIEFSNRYAPEHLEIMTENPEGILREIKNAGSIFLGNYSPVAAGDYVSGTNHVLPTAGTAKFSSCLSVRDFLKFSGIQNIDREGLKKISNTIDRIATYEGFDAHSTAIRIRYK